jgi:hypothetical protein
MRKGLFGLTVLEVLVHDGLAQLAYHGAAYHGGST